MDLYPDFNFCVPKKMMNTAQDFMVINQSLKPETA